MKLYLFLALAVVLPLAGCTAGSSGDSATAPPGRSAATEAKTPAPTATPAAFGESHSYPDGVRVRLDVLDWFVPSQSAAHGPNWTYFVAFKITVVNGSDKPLDLSAARIRAQDDDPMGAMSAEVVDPENGLGDRPSSKLLPGRQTSLKFGLAMNLADQVLRFAPNHDYEDAVFRGSFFPYVSDNQPDTSK